MNTRKTTYTISEYDSFVSGISLPGCITLPETTFALLEDFILSRHISGYLSTTATSADGLQLMSLGARRGVGRIITARNYVGVITLKDGTTIEILPKIFSSHENGETTSFAGISKTESAHQKARRLLVEMLKTLKSFPYKSLQTSQLDTARTPLSELFIQMFLQEVFRIVKHGLSCGYKTIQSNETQFKGKWKVVQHIKYNYAHRERAFLEYEIYHVNRAENRLIKATLLYLYQQSSSSKNKGDIKILLNEFWNVPASMDYQIDLNHCIPDRNTRHYETALLWCRIFLQGKSFSPLSGSETAFALLFPMELLFERYIAVKLKQYLAERGFQVLLQDTSRYLFEKPKREFLLRPDIVIIRETDQAVFLLDTKWKLLSTRKRHYGISQNDMYQMYAYQKTYQAEKVILLYPLSEDSLSEDSLSGDDSSAEKLHPSNRIEFYSGEETETVVSVELVDLLQIQHFLEHMTKQLQSPITFKCCNRKEQNR